MSDFLSEFSAVPTLVEQKQRFAVRRNLSLTDLRLQIQKR
jgi:hypothetical protein